ncbi:Sodium/calcium exchanger protein-domain-containing protein [Podospora didyma]|uniref:Sodium/calcium exchanger protein-domain-containing protein n=1 Tax=Podospora didyma TaxID=330526 RepID=A0AAE0P4U5_9PEZI|nr:Sodium/calcium exchanger protein-domain-containing protein [Podospora didyma]
MFVCSSPDFSASRSGRGRYSSRHAVASLALLALIATYTLFVPDPRIASNQKSSTSSSHGFGFSSRLATRGHLAQEADIDCRAVHLAPDQCAFILKNCGDDEAGLIHYLAFYYCDMANVKPVAFVILALWLGLLFTTIGVAASDFFSVNLSTIASVLGLSESLAGVTFLALGNGSPDVFSTFAAMGSNSGSMAVGELIGAAGFITAVVAGSMALVREFKVSKRTFVRDILFFIAAICFTMVFLADGELHLWECFTMIGFYISYVITVVGWHWFSMRRRRQRLRDAASRGNFYSVARAGDELEPYRDDIDDDDEAAPVGGRSRSAPEPADLSMLERADPRAPRIEVDGIGLASPPPDEDDEQREVHVAAEMTSSMRVSRPRWGRSNTTITPIRPSLVGVLEFRAVLSSLHRQRNMHLGPLPGRTYSEHPILERSSSSIEVGRNRSEVRGRPRTNTLPAQAWQPTRERALSYGNTPLNLENDGLHGLPRAGSQRPETRNSSTARTIDGRLAPPTTSRAAPDHTRQHSQSSMKSSQHLNIRIPSPGGGSSGQSSPSATSFPVFESPAILTPVHGSVQGPEETAFVFPTPSQRRRASTRIFEDHIEPPRPINWWPYRILPPPHILLATIFPTLQGWGEKSLWDKLISLISVPSIFVLVTTLPVVETDTQDDNTETDLADPPGLGHVGSISMPVSIESENGIEPETEWQEYRRRAHSVSSRSPLSLSPSLVDLPAQAGQASDEPDPMHYEQRPPLAVQVPPSSKLPTTGLELDRTTSSTEEPLGWNRWLVALQLITGPLFVVIIAWANMHEDMVQPGKTLVKLMLYALLFSMCLLATLLLTTTADKKPKYHHLLCYLGFVISVAWISTIAGEVVGVLKAFGVILGISEAILGLTIFAVGNSLGDLVADITVARLGYPVMALAACFGGPMLNILLGVGIGGAWMGISSANKKHKKHPDKPIHYKPYHIQVGGTLMISALTVLLTLVVLLIVVPSNKWVMSRKIGWGLIAIWSVSTALNLVVEITGTWAEVSW